MRTWVGGCVIATACALIACDGMEAQEEANAGRKQDTTLLAKMTQRVRHGEYCDPRWWRDRWLSRSRRCQERSARPPQTATTVHLGLCSRP